MMPHVCMSGVIVLQGKVVWGEGGGFCPPPDYILPYMLCCRLPEYSRTFPSTFLLFGFGQVLKTAYILTPFSCSGQTYLPTVKDFDSLNFK